MIKIEQRKKNFNYGEAFDCCSINSPVAIFIETGKDMIYKVVRGSAWEEHPIDRLELIASQLKAWTLLNESFVPGRKSEGNRFNIFDCFKDTPMDIPMLTNLGSPSPCTWCSWWETERLHRWGWRSHSSSLCSPLLAFRWMVVVVWFGWRRWKRWKHFVQLKHRFWVKMYTVFSV